jgi:hypothetical protein
MIEFRGRLILLDIEGTVSPLAFVHDVLFPFARREVGDFLMRQQASPEVLRALEQIARDSGLDPDSEGAPANLASDSDRAAWVSRIHALMDADAKQTGLKWLQGLIWDEGYQSGELKSVLFSDAVESKVKAEQQAKKAEHDLARIRTEGEQRVATAKAEAEAIKAQAEAINKQGGAEYVQLKWIEKWNGALPTTQLAAGGAMPLLQLPK